MLKSRLNPITFSEFTPQSRDKPQEPLGKTKSSRPLTFVLERRLKFKMYGFDFRSNICLGVIHLVLKTGDSF